MTRRVTRNRGRLVADRGVMTVGRAEPRRCESPREAAPGRGEATQLQTRADASRPRFAALIGPRGRASEPREGGAPSDAASGVQAGRASATASAPPRDDVRRTRVAGDEARSDEDVGGRSTPVDALDPSARHAAHLAPPPLPWQPAAAPPDAPAARAMRSLEDLLPAMVRKIAWAGDARRGSVRLELGAGAYAGATVLVHADDGRVRVEVSGPVDAEALRARLDARLRLRGLEVYTEVT